MVKKRSIKALCLHPGDNVATLLESGSDEEFICIYSRKGELIGELGNPGVPIGHKIALDELQPGQTIRKYGQSIGVCTSIINRGDWVHVHNMESGRGRGDQA